MITDKSLFTQTLARIYTEQGHFKKAAQIYQHLAQTWPDHPEYREALAQMENRLATDERRTDEDLIRLISTWFDLEIGYNRLKRLEALQTNRRPQREKMDTYEHIDIA
jgi:hypothetical protein